MFDKSGQYLINEKNVKKPIRTLIVKDCQRMGRIIDLFIFKQFINDEMQYNMYLILERGILYYPAVEKGANPVAKFESQDSNFSALKANCCDFNYITNTLVVDILKRD